MSERFESRYLNPIASFENSSLGVIAFRPETHVAQQRRREKLRTPQRVTPPNYTNDNHLIQLPSESQLNSSDLVQVLDQTMFSSEMLNFSINPHVMSSHKDAALQQEQGGGAQSSRSIGPDDVTYCNSSKAIAGPQNLCRWKGIGSQQPSCDWFVNYVNGPVGNACSQTPLFLGEAIPGGIMKETSLSTSTMYVNSGCNGYQDVVQDCPKQYGEMNFNSPSFYHNSLEEVVTSSTMGTQGFEMASLAQQNSRETGRCSWVDNGSEPVLLPTYGNQFGNVRFNNTDPWTHRQLEDASNPWNVELGNESRNVRHLDRVAGESNSRGLSLSLSSHTPSNAAQIGERERFVFENLQSRIGICSGSEDFKPESSGYICSSSKPSIVTTFHGNSAQAIAGPSVHPRRSVGPLGPFTGYATILKNSKFLKPAQQLLDEICSAASSKLIKTCGSSEMGSREASSSSDPLFIENVDGRGGSSDVSSSFNSSNQTGGEGRLGSGSCQSYNPEYQQKKAKLLFMQEEVCRRYKQYYQQMQMVMSSFESVAGLSSATPYTSLALKAVTRHFHCLKNAISDQIMHISKALGEEFFSPVVGTSRDESSISKLQCIDQNARKQQAVGNSLALLERQVPQQPIWRPQRGLPERAVAVLRAWLFEHFLHPYPTDTDKHMLATQTGLSRNQVSNWFINARVRVWKPMVEEMHMLETKGSSDTDQDSGNKNNQKADNNCNVGCTVDQSSNKMMMIDAMSQKQPECSAIQSVPAEVEEGSEQWLPHEKRCRVEHPIATSVDDGLIGFVPYQHSGLGAVSLTLGLRHSADQQQHHEHQLRHYGGQMIHDFVG